MSHRGLKILLRSSWQTVNIGDIAHTPGMLALLERMRPDAVVTLWPNELSREVESLLMARFPRLHITTTPEAQSAALEECDFFVHGSGPGLVGRAEAARAQKLGKPYGFAGITLSDQELAGHRDLLAGARFVFCRDTDSLAALRASGIACPRMEFGPDATFALDLRDHAAAEKVLRDHHLEEGRFLCAVPRLRYTPYWEIHGQPSSFDPEKDRVNRTFVEQDHGKVREAITAWVRELGMRVLIAPEMTYVVPRMRSWLYEPLPGDVKLQVEVLERYWLTAEAAAVYARAGAVVSLEMHSPIIAVTSGTPAILVRQPTDTRKGRMWRDIGLEKWIFEVDASSGAQIAARLVEIGRDIPGARAAARRACAYAQERMEQMARAITA